MQAGSVLRFYLWKEEKTQLLRKSGVGIEAGKKNASLGKHRSSTMVLFSGVTDSKALL